MVYIMTNSPDDTTATQQQRPQASQLPIDPVKIKAMIDYYIAEYREQLLDRDLLEQAIADDELFWRSSVWRVITSLIHIMRFSDCDPYADNYFDRQAITECRRFATDLLRDLQKISKGIPDLTAELPKIKQDVWMSFCQIRSRHKQCGRALSSSSAMSLALSRSRPSLPILSHMSSFISNIVSILE